jgi:hypothetical protein
MVRVVKNRNASTAKGVGTQEVEEATDPGLSVKAAERIGHPRGDGAQD